MFPEYETIFAGVPWELGVGSGGQEEPTKVNLYCIPIIHQHINKEVAVPKLSQCRGLPWRSSG